MANFTWSLRLENHKASVLDSLSAPFSGAAASFGDCLIAINKWITVWKPRRYNFTGDGPNTQWWNSPTLTYAALTYAEHDDPPTHPKRKRFNSYMCNCSFNGDFATITNWHSSSSAKLQEYSSFIITLPSQPADAPTTKTLEARAHLFS